MYKILILNLILICLTSCGGSTNNSLGMQCTIELNGDSIMSGLQIETFASSIKRLRPNFIITDKAVAGLTMRDLANGYSVAYPGAPVALIGPQLPFSMISRNSHVILIELGGNDAYGNYPASEFEQQLEMMIQAILAEGRIPVLTGIVPFPVSKTFDQDTIDRASILDEIVHTLAAKYNVIDANWRTVPYYGVDDTIDGIHRTQDAANRLVSRTIEVLDIACNK